MVRDLVYVYDECNREGVLQVLKPFKSKIVSKIHVLLWKVFAEMVTYMDFSIRRLSISNC